MPDARRPVRSALVAFLLLALALAAAFLAWTSWNPLWCTLLATNIAVLPLWIWDKLAARRRRRRVPELALHLMAALGAAPASLVAMVVLRHKTRKQHFWVLYVVLLALQIGGVAYWLGGADG